MGLDYLRLLFSGDHSSHPGYHGKGLSSFSVALIIMVMGILGVMLLAPFADFMPAWMHLPRMEVLPDLDFSITAIRRISRFSP